MAPKRTRKLAISNWRFLTNIGLALRPAKLLRQSLAPTLFDDHDRAAAEALHSSPIAKRQAPGRQLSRFAR
jgi:hypothetical protein